MRIRMLLAALSAAIFTLSLGATARGATAVHGFSHDLDVDDVHFSSDGATVATVTRLGLHFWSTTTGQLVREVKGSGSRAATIERGSVLLVAGDGLKLYDLSTAELLVELVTGAWVRHFEYGAASKRVVAILERRTLDRYDSFSLVEVFRTSIEVFDIGGELEQGWLSELRRALFGPSGPTHEIELGVTRGVRNDYEYSTVHFLPDDDAVITFGGRDSIVWSLARGAQMRRLPIALSGTSVSPDRTLYLRCGRTDATLWSLEQEKTVATFAFPGYGRNCEFSDGGSRVLIESVEFQRVFESEFDARSGKQIRSIELTPERRGEARAWSGDGTRLVVVDGPNLRVYGEGAAPTEVGRRRPGMLDSKALAGRNVGNTTPKVFVNENASAAVQVIASQCIYWTLP